MSDEQESPETVAWRILRSVIEDADGRYGIELYGRICQDKQSLQIEFVSLRDMLILTYPFPHDDLVKYGRDAVAESIAVVAGKRIRSLTQLRDGGNDENQ